MTEAELKGRFADARILEAIHKAAKWDADYRKQAPKGNPDFYFLRGKIMWDMFAKAVIQAKSVEPKAVAYALEGMRHDAELGEVEMRKSDHQLIQPLYVLTLEKSATLPPCLLGFRGCRGPLRSGQNPGRAEQNDRAQDPKNRL